MFTLSGTYVRGPNLQYSLSESTKPYQQSETDQIVIATCSSQASIRLYTIPVRDVLHKAESSSPFDPESLATLAHVPETSRHPGSSFRQGGSNEAENLWSDYIETHAKWLIKARPDNSLSSSKNHFPLLSSAKEN
jgi:hypothetical protein